jgi:hypothetical protein
MWGLGPVLRIGRPHRRAAVYPSEAPTSVTPVLTLSRVRAPDALARVEADLATALRSATKACATVGVGGGGVSARPCRASWSVWTPALRCATKGAPGFGGSPLERTASCVRNQLFCLSAGLPHDITSRALDQESERRRRAALTARTVQLRLEEAFGPPPARGVYAAAFPRRPHVAWHLSAVDALERAPFLQMALQAGCRMLLSESERGLLGYASNCRRRNPGGCLEY